MSAETQTIPSSLRSLLHFLSTDDRPTIVLDQASKSSVVYQNSAFDTFLQAGPNTLSFDTWLASIDNDTSDTGVRRTGKFGGQVWNLKRWLDTQWTLVYPCVRGFDGEIQSRAHKDPAPAAVTTTSPVKTCYDSTKASDWVLDWIQYPFAAVSSWTQHLRKFDWSKTKLGPMEQWPIELRQLLVTHMPCAEPRAIFWGIEGVLIVNEAGTPMMGNRVEEAMGQPLESHWGRDVYDLYFGLLRQGLTDGKPAKAARFEVVVNRSGFEEEVNIDMQILPASGPDGKYIAFVAEYIEVTAAVNRDRRHKLMESLLARMSVSSVLHSLWDTTLTVLEEASDYIGYAALYTTPRRRDSTIINDISTVNDRAVEYELSGAVCCESSLLPAKFNSLHDTALGRLANALQQGQASNQVMVLKSADDSLPSAFCLQAPNSGRITSACVLPITTPVGQKSLGCIVVGLNPRRVFDADDMAVMDSIRELVSKTASIIAVPEEQRNADDLLKLNQKLTQDLRLIEAEKSEAIFARMARNAPFGMYIVDNNGFPRFVNESWLKMFGFPSLEHIQVISRTRPFWSDCLSSEDDAREQLQNNDSSVSMVTQAGQPMKREFPLYYPTDPNSPAGTPRRFNRWIEAINMPEYDSRNMIVGMVGFIIDITDRKRAEELQTRRLEDALANKRAAENFIDMVSHEMRNPLSAILQLADSIVSSISVHQDHPVLGEDAATIIDAAITITACAQHQKTIVDDILNLSKLDADLMTLCPEAVNPLDLALSAQKIHEAECVASGIAINVEVEESYRTFGIGTVKMDRNRALQVIINLVGNAIKFTKTSKLRNIVIRLNAFSERPSWKQNHITYAGADAAKPDRMQRPPQSPPAASLKQDCYLQFTIVDSGRGLSSDEMNRLFQRFSQGSAKTYEQYGGSGLGLYICKKLTELQGGQIGVKSEGLNCGSTFAFYIKVTPLETLPVQQNDALSRSPNSLSLRSSANNVNQTQTNGSASRQKVLKPTKAHRILIVEDNTINQTVMAKQLRKLGCIVSVASDGLEALNFIQKLVTEWNAVERATDTSVPEESAFPISLILMDIEMPIMDGLTCTERIRALEREGQISWHIPIVAITANARNEQVERAKSCGVDDVITKPFRIPELVPVMETLTASHPPPARASHPQATPQEAG